MKRFFFQYKFTILAFIYFCIIVIYPINFYARLLPIMGCASILLIMNVIAKMRFSHLFVAVLIFMITFNAYISFAYSSYISFSIIGAIFETNSNEAKSVVGVVVLPAFVLLAISSFLIISSLRELKHSKLNIWKSLFLIFSFLLFLSSVSYRGILLNREMRDEYPKSPVSMFAESLNSYNPLIYGNFMLIGSYFYDAYLFNKYLNSEKMMPEGIVETQGNQVTKLFVIIGESANRNHLSLFGYDIQTTPFLDSLKSENENVFLYEGRAVASQTRTAVPSILSSNTARNNRLFRDEYSVIDLARKHGYQVCWLSNQPPNGLWNGRDMIGAIARGSDHSVFLSENSLEDDFALLPFLEKYYDNDDSKQLFVIHLQGSHFLYEDRYDKIDEEYLSGESTLLRQYDRTIYHTDRLLKKLYQFVERNNSSVLLYLSDHGQEIRKEFGHGVGKPTKSQFDVPVVVLNNSSIVIDSIFSQHIDPNDSVLSNNSMPFILSEIMGYSVSRSGVLKGIEEGRFVLHGDDYVYKYYDLE